MIDNASIESLKNSIDIVDVVGNFIELRKMGANYKANCPFHGEKTPSFVVSPVKQIYHCFGCGVGGDSIKFVMEMEKLSYPEAIEKLATMNNFSLVYTKGSSDYTDVKRVLEAVGQWYIKKLSHNKEAMSYLKSRGISQNSIEKFEVGYTSTNQEVMDFLQSSLLPLPKALDAGIIAQSQNSQGFYARLVERITFPIYTSGSSLVGFGGRTISNHPAKYINSPQTKLFNKSQLLYGYHLAKDSIYKNKKIIICEGYLDVIMFHQAGFTEAVAGMGTALTTEHLPLLRKGDVKVILAYDGDKAGVAAALKAAQMLSAANFDGGVVLFPDGQDPADLISKGESEVVARLLRDAKPLIPFVLEMVVSSYDLNNPREKEVAFGMLKEYLDKLSPIIKDAYIPMASTLLAVSSSYFGGDAKLSNVSTNTNMGRDDVAQLSIIKTLIEKPNLIDNVLSVLDISMFERYSDMFSALLSSDSTHSGLMGLSIDTAYEIMNEQELNALLCKFLIKHYEIKLKSIVGTIDMPYEKKSLLIRKIKTDIMPRLKRGELVAFDSTI